MDHISSVLTAIEKHRIIPVFYHPDPEVCKLVIKACYEGGIRLFEFTNRGDQAPANFKVLLEYRDANLPGLQLGIGTIKNARQAADFLDMGADFLVSPIVSKEVSEEAARYGKLWIPGCMTPTEISQAEISGAQLIKLFPGDTLGPAFLKAIKPLFPDLKFMPTGGVSLDQENIGGWLNAGVTAMGFGSKLFQQESGTPDNYAWLTQRCVALRELICSSGPPDRKGQ